MSSLSEEKNNIKNDAIELDSSSFDAVNAAYSTGSDIEVGEFREPTEEENRTLRRTTGTVPWYCYLILTIEFAERASYYCVSDRLSNFIELPLPAGSKTGKVMNSSQNDGALAMSLSRANSTANALSFFAYCFPLVTSYLADMYFKRMTMLKAGVVIGIVSHIIFIIAAIPSVIAKPNASYGVLFVGIFTLAWCTACIKPCLLPTLLQQYPHRTDVVTKTKKGELVIWDREQTLQKQTIWFYFAINLGAFVSLGCGYAARRIGYWLAFLIPMLIFLILPVVIFFLQGRIDDPKPVGKSILNDIFKIMKVAFEGNFIKRIRDKTFWEYPHPEYLQETQPERLGWRKSKPGWYASHLVNDTRVTLSACVIFLYYVMFNINDVGLGALINNLSASMTTNGVPNDVINNFNPLAIIFFVPFLDLVFYPTCRKMGIHWKPTWKIFTGFMIAALAMMVGAILQGWVYKHSPCGDYASTCDEHAPISLWTTAIIYALTGLAECFANTSAYTIAFLRAPNNMKSFVMALFLFQTALSSIVGIIISPAMVDPKLVRVFIGITVVGAAFAFGFLFQFWNLDKTMEKERLERLAFEDAEAAEAAELLAQQEAEKGTTSYELMDGDNQHELTSRLNQPLSPVLSAVSAQALKK
ncbi:hypothetical protein ACO0QE_001836 [Hanseniaspora vineae]